MRLIETGALISPTRRLIINPIKFDEVVQEIGANNMVNYL